MTVKPPCEDLRATLVNRISESASFRRAPKLRDLFLHICRSSLAGHDHLLTEQQIGQDVFGRGAGYNPGEDSIVRAQVRLLRRKLEAWYLEEGKAEVIHVSIPRGSYVPVWTEQPAEVGTPAYPAAEPAVPGTVVAGLRRSRLGWMVVVAAAALAAFAAGWFASRGRASAPSAVRAAAVHPILSKFLDNKYPILLVVQDASLILVNNSLRMTTSLTEYQSGRYRARLDNPALQSEHRRLLQLIDNRQYTSLGDLTVLRNLLDALPDAQQRIQAISARHLHHRQLKMSNAILLGGAGANPWVELYEGSLPFRLILEAHSGLVVKNLQPVEGELEVYRPDGATAYGVLAAMPNSGGSGSVLMMAGTSLEATEAASELVLTPERARDFAARLKLAAAGRDFRSFQAIVRASRLEGTSKTSELVALRVQ